MEFDPVSMARLEFAFAITLHIVFPILTIGLSAYTAALLMMGGASGRARYRRLAQFWIRILAVSLAMSVGSGAMLAYQSGAYWGPFSAFAGHVVGPLIGYGVLAALLLAAVFLGILLFGWRRVPNGLQVFAAVMVAAGAAISAFWILARSEERRVGKECRL